MSEPAQQDQVCAGGGSKKPPLRPEVRSVFWELLCAVVGVAVSLELLPNLPAVVRYSDALGTWIILAQVGGALALLSLFLLALGLGVTLPIAALARIPPGRALGASCEVFTALVCAFALTRGVKAWLHEFGGLGAQLASGRSAVWMGLVLLVAAAFWVRCRKKGSFFSGRAWRVYSSGMLALLVAGIFVGQAGLRTERLPTLERSAGQTAATSPDVVLITIDAFSARHSSVYGYARPTTPNLQTLAQGATVFDQFYANSNFTSAGVQSILSGTRPWTHRVFWVTDQPTPQSAAQSVLADFKTAGYQVFTVETNKWASPERMRALQYVDQARRSAPWETQCPADPNNWLERHADVHASAIVRASNWYAIVRGAMVRALIRSGQCPPSGHFDPVDTLAHAETLLSNAEVGRPVFLWVHLMPPHDPYAPPPPWLGMFGSVADSGTLLNSSPRYQYVAPSDFDAQVLSLQPRYDEALAYVDDAVGSFLKRLKQAGRFDKSVVVITSDHGESFSHAYGGHGGPELYEDLIRIPLIIKDAGQSKGARVRQPAEQADLAPTLCELTRISCPHKYEGRSLAGLSSGDADASAGPALFSMYFAKEMAQGAIAGGSVVTIEWPWKLHARLGNALPEGSAARYRLFRLDLDPMEAHDLAADHPALVERLAASIGAQVQRHAQGAR